MFIPIEDTFRSLTQSSENTRAWISLEHKLKTEFSKACRWWEKNSHRRRKWRDVYETYCDKNPKMDILPPEGYKIEDRGFEASTTKDVEFEHPYAVPDQKTDLWLYQSGLQTESYPRRLGHFGKLQLGSKEIDPKGKKGSAQRAITLRHLYGTDAVPLKVWNLYLIPSAETFKCWHNPFAVGRVYDEIYGSYKSVIPLYIPNAKKEMLAIRESHYGRALAWEEWMKIGSVNKADQVLVWLLRECWNHRDHPPEYLDDVVTLLRIHPGLGRFIRDLNVQNVDDTLELIWKWSQVFEKFLLDKNESKRIEKEMRDEAREIQKVSIGHKYDSYDLEDIRLHYATYNLPDGNSNYVELPKFENFDEEQQQSTQLEIEYEGETNFDFFEIPDEPPEVYPGEDPPNFDFMFEDREEETFAESSEVRELTFEDEGYFEDF